MTGRFTLFQNCRSFQVLTEYKAQWLDLIEAITCLGNQTAYTLIFQTVINILTMNVRLILENTLNEK